MTFLRTLFRQRNKQSDYHQIFIDFNKSLTLIKNKESLISSISARIYELIPTEQLHLLWEMHDMGKYVQIGSENSKLYLLQEDLLIKWLQLNESPLIVSLKKEEQDNIFSDHDIDVIKETECGLVYPLKVGNNLKGVVLLGKKRTNYPQKDIEMLSILLDNAALAIESIMYQDQRTAHLKKIFQTDRLAVIGQLAAGAAHEIRNPLTSIKSTIQYIEKDICDVRKQQMISSVLLEVDRINDILSGLLSFSRQKEPVKQQFDLLLMINQTLLLIENTQLKKQITFETNYSLQLAMINADKSQLTQVLMNILLNAVDAIKDDEGVIKIGVNQKTIDNEIFFVISIIDNGEGVLAGDIDKIFDPFFTTKEDGTGLGLSISYGIIQRHRGAIEIQKNEEKGVQVIIQLPQGNLQAQNRSF